MTDKAISAREKIAKLRQTFVDQLTQRILDARHHFLRMKQGDYDEEQTILLHRFFHSIKGSGRSFGFMELGQIASVGNEMATQLMQHAHYDIENWQSVIEDCFNALEEETAHLQLRVHELHNVLPNFTIDTEIQHCTDECLIYLCDDDPLQTEQLATQLSCFGYQYQIFNTTSDFRDAVLVKRPSAVIMDINFPEGNCAGIDVLAQLNHELSLPIPSIFLSTRNDFEARLRVVQIGGSAYFQKPARALDIVTALDGLTHIRKPEPFRVLIVDDEHVIASYHAVILQQAGMLTQEINDPKLFLEALKSFHPDIVLMDMYMPCCHGRDLAKMVRQIPEYISLPIVYLSSETDQKKQFSAMKVGAEGFLTKPVEPEELVSAVAIRAERMRTLREIMSKDSLTDLFNHTTTTQQLEKELHSAKRHHHTLCFAMIDIDHFKSVNDTYGHPIGDQVILAISRVLKQRLRHSDIVGRYGGEEFALILPETTLEKATIMLDQLRKDFSRVQFHAEHHQFSCTFSAGIACYPNYETLESLRGAADKALYQAKHNGRNQVISDPKS